MPNKATARQRKKMLADIQREVLADAVITHLRFGWNYIRAGRADLAYDEAESARRALKRVREIA